MTPDDLKNLRKQLGINQKVLAELLELDVALIREWEKGERFPTKANVDAMEKLRANPPPRRSKDPSPLELLADPAFFTLLRKLIAHKALRTEVDRLAASYADPLDDDDDEGASPAAKKR